MIVCECGRTFNNIKGFNAHSFYCDKHVESLPEEQRQVLLDRRKKNKQTCGELEQIILDKHG